MSSVRDLEFCTGFVKGGKREGGADHGILGVNLYEAAQADHRGHLNLECGTST